MKRIKLFHNPIAGDEEHTKKELLSLIKSNGFECTYVSVKEKDWKEFEEDLDFIIVAGGDGTVRKITKALLSRTLLERNIPIALLPLGTANNIAKTLGINGDTKEIIKSWQTASVKKYDVGRIEGVPESNFFLESFGYGLFPYLIKEIEKVDKRTEMHTALELLHRIIVSYEPHFCRLKVDETDHSGKFLMAEIMNTRSMGPNLVLSPLADPGDGEFEVVLVPESQKDKFAAYVLSKIQGAEETYQFHTLKAKKVNINWEGTHVHLDDKIAKIEKSAPVKIELKAGVLEFLVP
jgi:diacylglycerol kinase family enzyme